VFVGWVDTDGLGRMEGGDFWGWEAGRLEIMGRDEGVFDGDWGLGRGRRDGWDGRGRSSSSWEEQMVRVPVVALLIGSPRCPQAIDQG